MMVVIKRPGEKIKFCNVKNSVDSFEKIIGAPFAVLPKGNLNIFLGKDVNVGKQNICIDGVNIHGPIIITGSTVLGLETDVMHRHLKEIKRLNVV